MAKDPSDKDDADTRPPAEERKKGSATVALEATELQRERDRERREEETAKDDKMVARLDAANAKALEAESKRADDAVEAARMKDVNWAKVLAGKDKTTWYLYVLIAVLIAALLVAVFDKTVGFDWTKGTVNAGDGPAVEAPVKIDPE